MKNAYTTFLLMLLTSGAAMYTTMYFNSYVWEHVYFSWTRLYMTCLGVAAMALVMFFYMRKMYKNREKNMAIVIVSVLVMVLATYLVRQQKPIGDVRWMQAMIPHHSIAILTSTRAQLEDEEVRKLATEIIEAQKREIEEMKAHLKRLENEAE
ncbi:DUF305 domain-containing protein [Maribacter sp. 2307ULW6-5]|uniref:DUF305 domain-containing protein n=1 Tax=Maribacter sp. 2307ULW6-5 TaxID=3386275 RepID=UPI0039BD6AC5